jgi:hypothetical protein
MGFATVAILAGLGAVMCALSSYGASDTSGSSTQYVKDGKINPSGLVISKPEGSIGGEVQLKHLAQGIPGDKAYLTTNDLTSTAAPSSAPQVTPSQSITATPSLGMPSSTKESQQLSTSISKLTDASQLQIEELKKLNAVATLDKVNLANLNNIEKASEITKVKEADKTQETGKTKEANIFSKIGETIKNSFADSVNIISKITSTDAAKTKTSTVANLDKTIASTLTTSASTFVDTANKLNTVTKATTSDLATMVSSSMSDAVKSTNNATTNTSSTNLNAVKALDTTITNLTSAADQTKEAFKSTEVSKNESNSTKFGETIKNIFVNGINDIVKNTLGITQTNKTSTTANLDKTTATDLNKSISALTSETTKSNTADTSNKTVVTDLTKSVSSFTNDVNKSTNTANITNLNAANALNKTNLTSILDTVDKTQLIKDVTNFEEERIKNSETNLNTTNLFQPTPLNNSPETKLVAAPASTSAVTNNNGVSTVVNSNTVAGSSEKLDRFIEEQRKANEILVQILHKNSNINLDSRQLATITSIGTSRT